MLSFNLLGGSHKLVLYSRVQVERRGISLAATTPGSRCGGVAIGGSGSSSSLWVLRARGELGAREGDVTKSTGELTLALGLEQGRRNLSQLWLAGQGLHGGPTRGRVGPSHWLVGVEGVQGWGAATFRGSGGGRGLLAVNGEALELELVASGVGASTGRRQSVQLVF